MKRHSFFIRLFVGNLLLVGTIAAVICAVSYVYLNAEYRRRNQADQDALCHVLRAHFQRNWPADGQIDDDAKALVAGLPVRLTVIAADGRVLGDSQADPADMANHKTDDRPEVLAALDGRPGSHVRASETLGVEFRYLARPVVRDGRVAAVVRVALPVKRIVESSRFIGNALWWAALAAAAAAVALGLLLSWLWYVPLRQITRAARQIAGGNLTCRASISGSDELAQLGAALNEMRRSLAEQIELIAAQRANLAAIVANLREGVVALDADQRVVLMNAAAVEMLAPGAAETTGQHLQAVVRIPKVLGALANLAPDRTVSTQVTVEDGGRRRVLDLHAADVGSGASGDFRVLLVVRDITQIARTAEMKAEFVANASHELRTPLATIRAAVDSLAAVGSDDPDAFRKFVGMLDRHVRRLEHMTSDLLSLHLVESAKGELRLARIDTAGLAEWVRSHFAVQAGEKNVTLVVRTDHAPEAFASDRRLVQLILENLLDNAVKFTPAGGRVDCCFQGRDDRIALCVADTGCGIPPEIQPRVFERFFQAEPSRTGDSNVRGTGLGLAIVKYAAERLGAGVCLESRPGQGTTVTVLIPCRPDA